MTNQTSEEELFEQLSGVDSLSIDPQLKGFYDLMDVVQEEIKSGDITTNHRAELDKLWPFMNQIAEVTGELYGPVKNEDGDIDYVTRNVVDQRVLLKGVTTTPLPINRDKDFPVITLLFEVSAELMGDQQGSLKQAVEHFYAAAPKENVQIKLARPSAAHIENIVREIVPTYAMDVDDILFNEDDPDIAVMELGRMSFPIPEDEFVFEGLHALADYAFNTAQIDRNLPYKTTINGPHFIRNNDGILEKRLGDLGGKGVTYIADVKSLQLVPVLIQHGEQIVISGDLHWALELGLYGDDPENDLTTTLVVPIIYLKKFTALRRI